ncbi:SgcJ/EcaC family oxidoreductase [uncultured Roseibium sp.]|uniref:YybH family protein n=1 Tax=uncultured Roseibium sp. TaxID=1936171 RepID=UPI003216F570
MLFRLFIASLIALSLSGAAAAQDNPIVKRLADFTLAYNARDASAIAGFYTEKAALLPPRSKALVGREPISTHYAKAFADGVGDLTYKVLEIEQTGPDTAVEIGETQVKLGKRTIMGRSMHVWKNTGGQWFLHRDIYHVLAVSK